jgi:hypothetical protein
MAAQRAEVVMLGFTDADVCDLNVRSRLGTPAAVPESEMSGGLSAALPNPCLLRGADGLRGHSPSSVGGGSRTVARCV